MVIHVNEAKPRISILWDNDQRDSLSSLAFTELDRCYSYIAGLVGAFRVEGYDVDVTSVEVLNPGDEHQSWMIDWDSPTPNARVLTLS